jgi:diaminopimelate epimerase
MHGLGNDFILLDLRQQNFFIDEAIARQLSNRRTGIGCDQILILRQPSNESKFYVTVLRPNMAQMPLLVLLILF